MTARLSAYISMVLLIDDQPMVGDAVKSMLVDEPDIDMHYCQDPAQAAALATQLRPTVILLDLLMPTMNGIELLRRLRKNPATTDTPIIALSTADDPSTKRDAFAAGANDYLLKFPDRLELIARVRYHSVSHLNRLQRDEAYLALRISQQKLEEATNIKSQFLASVSHEIRTPLSGVIGMTALLADTSLTKEQAGYVETIRSSGSALLELISDILDFSKIETGQIQIADQPFDLVSCIEETLDSLALKASEKRLALGYSIDRSIPREVFGDVGRVRQILVNILSNAVKFTMQGEVSLRVLQPAGREGPIEFSICDTGIGIPRDRQQLLFKPFNSVNGSSINNGGTGLGLAISKALCERMGGRIWLDSDTASGSTFHFTLKLRTDSNVFLEHDSPVPAPPNVAGKRVLIIEDKPLHLEALKLRAENLGMTAAGACTSEGALQSINDGIAFDAVILNSRVQDVDILELVRRIRSTPTGSAMRLILMTPLHVRHLSAMALEAGVSSLLYEPIRDLQFREVFKAAFDVVQTAVPVASPTSDADRGGIGSRLPLRILLAEDNTVNQIVAVSFLKKLGYRADVVSNGRQVIRSLERQAYDVVLMDVLMPEMNGDEAAREICQRWRPEERPKIIAMTADAMQGDREKYLSAGMDDYLSKPVSLKALQDTLERWAKSIHART
jgi:signal transduction histidine kinase